MKAQGLGAPIDLAGQIYGRLKLLEQAENQRGQRMWKCVYQCGARIVVDGNSLRREHSRSCGAPACKARL
jgi:hypothetical protein